QARDIAARDRVAFEIVGDDRDLLCCRDRRFYRGTSCCDKNGDAESNEFSHQVGKNLRIAMRPTRFHPDRLALDIADLTPTVAQCIKNGICGIGKSRMEKSDDRDLLYLLRLRQHGLR